MPGIDGAVVDGRIGFLDHRRRWRGSCRLRLGLWLAEQAEDGGPRIGREEMDARHRLARLGPAAKDLPETLGRIEQPEEKAAFSFAFGFGFGFTNRV